MPSIPGVGDAVRITISTTAGTAYWSQLAKESVEFIKDRHPAEKKASRRLAWVGGGPQRSTPSAYFGLLLHNEAQSSVPHESWLVSHRPLLPKQTQKVKTKPCGEVLKSLAPKRGL